MTWLFIAKVFLCQLVFLGLVILLLKGAKGP